MPKVTVTQQSSMTPDEAFQRIHDVLSNSSDLKKLDSSYSFKADKESLSGVASGKLFTANLHVQDRKPGCLIEIIVSLPFHLAFAKGLVRSTLERKIKNAISG